MRRVLLVLLLVAVVMALAWTVAGLPGHVVARIGGDTLSASTPVAVLVGLLLFVAAYALVRLLVGLFTLPRTVRRNRGARARRGGDQAVTRTLVALAAGDAGNARSHAARARKLLGDTPQTLLLASEAGRLAGRDADAEAALRALSVHPEAAFLGHRGLLRLAMERGDWTEAAVIARQAEAAHPGATWLRGERGQLAIRTGNWSEALALADADAPKATLSIAAAETEPNPAHALRLAKGAWDEQPGTPSALAYARRLREAGREQRAQEVLRAAWALAPQPELAALSMAPVIDKLDRVQAAKRLAQENPEHPESHYLLAAVSHEAGLQGEARHQADDAERAGMTDRRLWNLRAEIEHDDPEASREALRRAASAAPEPGWRCTACGTPSPSWRAACAACGRVGTVAWDAAPPLKMIERSA